MFTQRTARGAESSSRGEPTARGRSRRRGLLGALLVCAFALGVVAPAQAEVTYNVAGSFGEGAFNGVPNSMAIDQSNGDVYVTDAFGGTSFKGRVVKFDFSTEPPTQTIIGDGISGDLRGIALDPTTHDIYVSAKQSGAGLVYKFDSEGNELGSFPSVEFPNFGAAADSAGNFYVPTEGGLIEKFSPSGESLATYDCSGCPGAAFAANGEGKPVPIGTDSAGNLFIVAAGETESRYTELDSSGNYVSSIEAANDVRTGAVDPVSGSFFAGADVEGANFHVEGFDSSLTKFADFGEGVIADGAFNVYRPAPAMGVAANGDVYVAGGGAFGGDNLVWVFAPVLPPIVATGGASGIAKTAATIKGTVNPNGRETTECLFEYGTTTGYGSTAPCTGSPGSANEPVEVSAELTGLTPGTEYHYRLFAANADGETPGEDATFTTLPQPAPAVETLAATAISQTAATLNGSVNAEGASSSCTFEYGTTAAYGKSIACSVNPVTGEVETAVSAALTGLTANTTYHFRVVAENSSGETPGSDMTFSTLADTCQTNAALCPPADTDKDGVPDTEDQCVSEPGPASNHGCPVKEEPPRNEAAYKVCVKKANKAYKKASKKAHSAAAKKKAKAKKAKAIRKCKARFL